MSTGLGRMSLSRKDGWKRFTEARPRSQPELLSTQQLATLDEKAKARHDEERREWHANLTIRTPQLASVHEDLWDIVDSNQHDGDKVKGAAAIDAFPGLGKTTTAVAFGRELHRRELLLHGELTEEGHEYLPVCRVGLTSNTTMRNLNAAILRFYGHPGARRGTADEMAARALDCILSCGTKLVLVDDVHFLNMRRRDGIEVSNHLKWLANEFPVTFLFVGVGLSERGLLSEGMTAAEAAMAQTARRWTRLTVEPFKINNEDGRARWRSLLLAIEQMLVLANKYPGMLADDLADYLFARSTGHIGSLMSLINRGAQRAMRQHEERITQQLLDCVKIDEAAEVARRELAAAMAAGRLTSKPRHRASRTRKQPINAAVGA